MRTMKSYAATTNAAVCSAEVSSCARAEMHLVLGLDAGIAASIIITLIRLSGLLLRKFQPVRLKDTVAVFV